MAGAFVGDHPGAAFNLDAYLRQIDAIRETGGVPVVFQSYGLTSLPDDRLIDAYTDLGKRCDRFIAFELVLCSRRSARFIRWKSTAACSA